MVDHRYRGALVDNDPPSLMVLSNNSENNSDDAFADDASDSDVTSDFESLTYVSCDDCEQQRSPSPQKKSGPFLFDHPPRHAPCENAALAHRGERRRGGERDRGEHRDGARSDNVR